MIFNKTDTFEKILPTVRKGFSLRIYMLSFYNNQLLKFSHYFTLFLGGERIFP